MVQDSWRTVGEVRCPCAKEFKVEVRQHQGSNSECPLVGQEDRNLPGLLCLADDAVMCPESRWQTEEYLERNGGTTWKGEG